MAIIVNKEEKRRQIAMACEELLLEHGIRNITISQIAKTAGVGKGTIYEYFANKEEIVFEIMSLFIVKHTHNLQLIIDSDIGMKEKLVMFFTRIFDEVNEEHLRLYREFIAISLQGATDEMVEFSTACRLRFIEMVKELIRQGIDKGEIRPETIDLADTWMIYATGLTIDSKLTTLYQKKEIVRMIENIFNIVKTKEKE